MRSTRPGIPERLSNAFTMVLHTAAVAGTGILLCIVLVPCTSTAVPGTTILLCTRYHTVDVHQYSYIYSYASYLVFRTRNTGHVEPHFDATYLQGVSLLHQHTSLEMAL